MQSGLWEDYLGTMLKEEDGEGKKKQNTKISLFISG